MKEKHLIVVSVDAMVYEDLEYAATLPTFGRLLREGALIKHVKTIYPSLTHPVHATMITGAPAGVTGIICNEYFEPGNMHAPWYNFLEEIRCDTIFHAARRAGLTSAVCTWPVAAKGNGVIDYCVPGMFDAYFEEYPENPLDGFRAYGACEEIMDIIEEGVKRFGPRAIHPEVEEFQAYCCAEIIRKHKPNLLFTHPCYVDHKRHSTGLFTEQVQFAVQETERWLTQMYEAVCDAGIEDTTDFVVLSDHGQLGIVRRICPNVFLADKGYLKADAEGKLLSWEVYAKTCGLSAQIYLARPEDQKLYDEVYALLQQMAEEKIYGFDRVFTDAEVKERYGLYGDFSFVIETDGYTSFSEECSRPAVRELVNEDYRFGKATHGHMPERGPQPPFIGMGPSFRKGAVLEEGNILNHAPTFAKILGLELKDATGHAEDRILR